MTSNRFLLINLVSPFTSHVEAERELDELKSLVSTFGGATIVHIIQRKMQPDSHTYIGKGKLEEVETLVKDLRINTVVINDIVKPSQLFNILQPLWKINHTVQVWDRVDLILQIFGKHAHTAEAKLQIELASMHHMGPRIYGLGTALSRQGGGIGTRGLGETNIELMKRHWRDAIHTITKKLEKMTSTRQAQIQRRKESGLKTVSIIGYTNAGKSTLFNVLTKKKKLAANVLFATLDSTVGRLYMPNRHIDVLVTDTIGFIQNLPTSLIDAFKSTLMESVNADLLLHVIDIADPLIHEKIIVVEDILQELGIAEKRKIYVFNKIDQTNDMTEKREDLREAYGEFNPQFVSAHTEEGMHRLVLAIEQLFNKP